MNHRRGPIVVVAVVAALFGASCTSGDDAMDRSTTTTAPAPLPKGVLVPGGSIVLGANPAKVDATFADGQFQMTAASGKQSIAFMSSEGTLVGPTGYPIRCGNVAFPARDVVIEERTEVAGPGAQVIIGNGDGEQVSIAILSPAMRDAHPDQPERLARLPLAELLSSVLLTPQQAQQLADQPADDPLIVHHWSHEFDNGLSVDAELGGSLARDLFYRFTYSGSGRGGEATNLSGIPCNDRAVLTSYTDTATYNLVLLAGGTTLRVDGKPVTDTIPDSTMQGEWVATKVTKAEGTAKAEVFDRNGKRIAHWKLTYTSPEDAD